ncbi:hypothetical protein ACTFIU_004088 [Dictyostelium citrinum]
MVVVFVHWVQQVMIVHLVHVGMIVDCPLGQGNSSGKCACDSKYTGNNYEISSLYSSSTTNLGLVILYGWFGLDATTESKVVIGSSDYFIKTINSATIECIIEAGTGNRSINITSFVVWYHYQ